MQNKLHLRSALIGAGLAAIVLVGSGWALQDERDDAPAARAEKSVKVEFLEIVTADLDATCKALSKLHGVTFSEPVPEFGNSRTVPLAGGGILSVRAPMHAAETPVVRPYLLVDDIAAAAKTAEAGGGEILHPPLKIEGRGTFAIYQHGGNQHGLWQN